MLCAGKQVSDITTFLATSRSYVYKIKMSLEEGMDLAVLRPIFMFFPERFFILVVASLGRCLSTAVPCRVCGDKEQDILYILYIANQSFYSTIHTTQYIVIPLWCTILCVNRLQGSILEQ